MMICEKCKSWLYCSCVTREEQRSRTAHARGYQAWKVSAFVTKLNSSSLRLEFLYCTLLSRAPDTETYLKKLIDEYSWDLNHWEQANILFKLQLPLSEDMSSAAQYKAGIARSLDAELQKLEGFDLVTGQRKLEM